MKTITLFLMLTISMIATAQKSRNNSLELTANFPYMSFGLQYNKEFQINHYRFDYQVAVESNFNSYARTSIGTGTLIYDNGVQVYGNIALAYTYLNDKINIAPEFNGLANSLNYKRDIKHELSPEIGLFININERSTCSFSTDIFRFVAYLKIGYGFRF